MNVASEIWPSDLATAGAERSVAVSDVRSGRRVRGAPTGSPS